MSRAEIEGRIAAARNDAAALDRIANELRGRDEEWAGVLRLRAIGLHRQLMSEASGSRPPPSGVSTETVTWHGRYGLPAPNGQPLYRYRLPSDQFTRLQESLAAQASALRFAARPDQSALFVLWAAEWFRRRYQGGMQRWDDVGRPIGLRCEWTRWRDLADTGLRQWRIPPLRLNGVHHRLAAIARQGGFPVAAIETGGGWAAAYLERLVGLLLAEADPTLELADGHAAGLIGMVPDLWRNDEMRVVSAELSHEVVRLRRLAEAAGAVSGALVSAWLDDHEQGWRDELPLVVDGDAGRALVDGLMRAAPVKGGSGSVRAARILALRDRVRHEGIRLTLSGSLQDSVGRTILTGLSSNWSRLRLFPSGRCAQHISGELAIAEPDDADVWTARTSLARADFPLPFSIAAEAELRGEGQRVCSPFILPGGQRLDEGLRVGVSDHDGKDELSEILLLGTGSGGYRAEPLYLDLPADWAIEPHGDDASCAVRHAEADGRSLWEVRGAALVRSNYDDVYLVRAGQAGDRRDVAVLIGDSPQGCAHAGGAIPLYRGGPRFAIGSGTRPRSPAPGEAWWRPKGEGRWRPYGGEAEPGLVEFAWRDTASGHIRFRTEAALVPADFRIERATVGANLTITIHGWPGAVLLDAGEPVGRASWRFGIAGSNRSSCEAVLRGDGADIALSIPLPHRSWIAAWDTGPVARNSMLSLSTINRFVARSEGRCELMADLFDGNGKPVAEGKASWWVEDELPLSAIRDDLAALLRPLGDIDARVKLNFNDAHENYWYVTEFGLSLQPVGRGFVPDHAVADADVRVVGRLLTSPAQERDDFGVYGLGENANHRPFELPILTGDWLIYLRQGERVLSRPYFIRGRPPAVPLQSSLSRLMALPDRSERMLALDALCDDLLADPAGPQSRACLREIIDLAISLNGLPPATFDILSRLATRPIGPLLLFSAAPVEVAPLMAIADGLPFAWSTIAKAHWDTAAEAQFRVLEALMPDELITIASAIGGRRQEILAVDGALAPLLDLPTSPVPRDVAVQSFLNRSADRIPTDAISPFRPRLDALLPAWPVSPHFHRALDAPIAAALAALGLASLDRMQIYCIKDIARRHPRYFREAFAASFREKKLG